jgi:NAD(P)-dependent dehydrogenase (short-subunit alcohol dehydrogenase family)
LSDLHVVIGVRGFGRPIARRLGQGARLLLADFNEETLRDTANSLGRDGFAVESRQVDVADRASVRALVDRAAEIGGLKTLVLTAGLSPHMGTAERIFSVNMLGTIHVLEEFECLANPGTVAVVIASNAGYMAELTPEIERRLALAPADELMGLFEAHEMSSNGLGAYCFSKRGTQLRAQAAAPVWGKRGARVASVSPGIMATPMSDFERDAGSLIDEGVAGHPVGRIGVPDDIAEAVAWIASPKGSFFTGADLLVDGGMTSALRWSDLETSDPLVGT